MNNKQATKVSVRHLIAGDVLATGESIVSSYAGVRTRKGYRTVVAERPNGSRWVKEWNASTTLTVLR